MMGSANTNGIQMMGMLNALKTGNPTADAFLAVAVPYALSTGVGKARAFVQDFVKKWTLKEEETPKEIVDKFCYKRVLSFTSGGKNHTTSKAKTRNEELYRAIQLFIFKTSAANLDDNAIIEFHEEEARVQEQGRKRPGSEALEALKRCEVVEKMPLEQWHSVGMYDGHQVKIMFSTKTTTEEAPKDKDGNIPTNYLKPTPETANTINLKSTGPKSTSIFINQVFTWYLKVHETKSNEYRYLFDTDGRLYRLSDEKTFESLFSKPCRELAKIVDHFHHKTGKYAIKGYPQKLGVMLYGPPGTGKTSVIKALANKTGRSIANINLSSMRTNADLKRAIFERQYYNEQGQNMQLGFFDIIFVLEDLDADSSVVRSRTLKPKAKKRKKKEVAVFDALNLTGLLNVLDGIVDTPGRMIVITTNHPEMLDPALIRPGRIDKILELGYMSAEDIILMIQHYFEAKLSTEEADEIQRMMLSPGASFTPAVVEQITIENDTIPSMIQALSKLMAEQKVVGKVKIEEEHEGEEEDEEEEEEVVKRRTRSSRKRGRK